MRRANKTKWNNIELGDSGIICYSEIWENGPIKPTKNAVESFLSVFGVSWIDSPNDIHKQYIFNVLFIQLWRFFNPFKNECVYSTSTNSSIH